MVVVQAQYSSSSEDKQDQAIYRNKRDQRAVLVVLLKWRHY